MHVVIILLCYRVHASGNPIPTHAKCAFTRCITDTGLEHLWTSICYRFVGVMDLEFHKWRLNKSPLLPTGDRAEHSETLVRTSFREY